MSLHNHAGISSMLNTPNGMPFRQLQWKSMHETALILFIKHTSSSERDFCVP